ncbi:MAG: ATP-binding protein [Planctomycetaceae bacterium]
MGSLVGESKKNVRQALQIAEAMAPPSILFVDEIEKGLSGRERHGRLRRLDALFGSLLSWLADHDSEVFFIATANDIRRLRRFTRAERPGQDFLRGFAAAETAAGYLRCTLASNALYDIGPSEPIPADDGWTGAEIKSCCRLSATNPDVSRRSRPQRRAGVYYFGEARRTVAKLGQWPLPVSGSAGILSKTHFHFVPPQAGQAVGELT